MIMMMMMMIMMMIIIIIIIIINLGRQKCDLKRSRDDSKI